MVIFEGFLKVYGKSKSYGATIRRQECKNEEEGISAFMFGPPVRKGKWNCYSLVPNMLVELRSNDADTRGTVLEDFFVSMMSKYGKDVPYPSTLDSIIPYTGVSKYEEIDVSTLSDGNGKDDTSGQKTGNQGNAENPRRKPTFACGCLRHQRCTCKDKGSSYRTSSTSNTWSLHRKWQGYGKYDFQSLRLYAPR